MSCLYALSMASSFFYIFDQTPVIESYIKTKLTKTCAMHRFHTVNPVLSSHSKIDKIDKWQPNEGRSYCRMLF